MWVEFVVGSLLCSERFFSGYSGFPLSPKTNTSKFQFDLETVDEEPPCGNATAKSYYYLLLLLLLLKFLALRRSKSHFLVYNGMAVDITGHVLVDVEHNGRKLILPLFFVWVEKYAPPLLGTAWMTKIRLDWKDSFSPSNGQFVVEQDNNKQTQCLKVCYAQIFKLELGTIKGVTAKLYLKDDVMPVFQKACPVPYVLRRVLEKEVKRWKTRALLSQQKLVIGSHPLSMDGSIHVCDNYKGTLNPAIQSEQFPIPVLELILEKVSIYFFP